MDAIEQWKAAILIGSPMPRSNFDYRRVRDGPDLVDSTFSEIRVALRSAGLASLQNTSDQT